MKAIKDKKKFGKDKIPKNKNSKKGYYYDKEYRKQKRKAEAKKRDDILHKRFSAVDAF